MVFLFDFSIHKTAWTILITGILLNYFAVLNSLFNLFAWYIAVYPLFCTMFCVSKIAKSLSCSFVTSLYTADAKTKFLLFESEKLVEWGVKE